MRKLLTVLIALSAVNTAAASEETPIPSSPTLYRELTCSVSVVSSRGETLVSALKKIDIPEAAFNYTTGMQTFWLPLNFAYHDWRERTSREVAILVAMDKLGQNYGLSYLSISIKNLNRNRIEDELRGVQGSASRIGSQLKFKHKKFIDDAQVECTLQAGLIR